MAKGERRVLGTAVAVVELATDKAADIPSREMIPLSKIRVDGGTQMRAGLRDDTVAEYREIMELAEGWGNFPPVEVVYDGDVYWMTDGFHRYAAAQGLIAGDIPAEVLAGDRRVAVRRAMAANATHGLRRNNADKRRSVVTALMDAEWGTMADKLIAEMCVVSARFVGLVREEMTRRGELAPMTTRTGADGRTINVANIGQRAKPTPAPAPVLPPDRTPLPGAPRLPMQEFVEERRPQLEPVMRFGDDAAVGDTEDFEAPVDAVVYLEIRRSVVAAILGAVGEGALRPYLTAEENEELEAMLDMALGEREA